MTRAVADLQLSMTCASLEVAAKRAERKRDENSDRRRERSRRPLVLRLSANQHEVFALTRSPNSAPLREIGAEPIIADALDAAAVKAAVGRIRPDVVINELTSVSH